MDISSGTILYRRPDLRSRVEGLLQKALLPSDDLKTKQQIKTALNCALLLNKKCFSFPLGLHIQTTQKRLREAEVQVRRVPVTLTRSL